MWIPVRPHLKVMPEKDQCETIEANEESTDAGSTNDEESDDAASS